jgi:hypothetical protein
MAETHRILICGDRNWLDHRLIWTVLCEFKKDLGITTVIEGGAKGADTSSALAGRLLGLAIREHPALWSQHGKAAGPIRNRLMLKDEPELVVAFHDDLTNSKGTKNMCQLAIMAGVKTLHCMHIDGGWAAVELTLKDVE